MTAGPAGGAAWQVGAGPGQVSGWRLIGPYSVRSSSSSVTWSTPSSSSAPVLAQPAFGVALAAECLRRHFAGPDHRPVRLFIPPGPDHSSSPPLPLHGTAARDCPARASMIPAG